MKKIFINVAIFAAFVAVFGMTAHAQRVLGGYKAADVDSEQVTAAAEFAVSSRAENNSEQEGLELVSVDKAEYQTVGGTNYRLCLTVSIDDESQQVEAVVFVSLQKDYTLKSWTVKDCAQ